MNKAEQDLTTVAIAQKRTFGVEDEKFYERHAPLVNRLALYGVQGVALRGAEDRDHDRLFSTHYQFDDRDSALNKVSEPLQVHAAFDLTGGIARYTPAVAALNPLGVREVALSKQLQYDTLSTELGEAVPTTVTTGVSKEEVTDALEAFDKETVIVKPTPDLEKKYGMLIGSKSDITSKLDDFISGLGPKVNHVLVQEYMPEVESTFADGIRYFDDTERAIADARPHLGRELRVHTIDTRPVLVTGRVGLNAVSRSLDDEWVHLDADSIPSHIHSLAATASKLIQNSAQAQDSYLAVDLTPDGRRIIEVNGRNIGTMRANSDRKGSLRAHDVITDELAQKLANMARNNRGNN